MKKIRHILLNVEDNKDRQTFIAEVATVAIDTGAQVTLLSVLDTPPEDQEKRAESSDLQQWLQEARLEQMQAISAEFDKKGIQVPTKQSSGKPYLEIIREALKGGYDLLMKPAESVVGIKNMLFGGTDMQLFRLCPCPVWVFKPTSNTELRKIMIAVDLLVYDQEKSTLADKVLQWGKYVADLVEAELHVVHIWDLYGEMTLRGGSVSTYTVDKLVQDEEQKHRQWLNDALARNGLKQERVQIHFHKGEARKLIPEIANAMETDLLVMGTVGRTGIPGFFMGNTADSVLRQVDCSVLAIKPDGFLSPVKVG
ncbi:MAG: universal stress protein [Sideroxyarcus sp.]|nr:universal stress protein [Sideroxyarcus sp.]